MAKPVPPPTSNRKQKRAAKFGVPPKDKPIVRLAASMRVKRHPDIHFDLGTILGLVGVIVGIISLVFPPQTAWEMGFWLVILWVSVAYLIGHIVAGILVSHRLAIAIGVLLALLIVVPLGIRRWPHPPLHFLSRSEQLKFEKEIKPPGVEKIAFGCPPTDDRICTLGDQFPDLFGESGWPIEGMTRVQPGRLEPGVVIVVPSLSPSVRFPGKWFNMAQMAIDPSVVHIRDAFVSIGIEPDMSVNPGLAKNAIGIYFGEDRPGPSARTPMTDVVELWKSWQEAQHHPNWWCLKHFWPMLLPRLI